MGKEYECGIFCASQSQNTSGGTIIQYFHILSFSSADESVTLLVSKNPENLSSKFFLDKCAEERQGLHCWIGVTTHMTLLPVILQVSL